MRPNRWLARPFMVAAVVIGLVVPTEVILQAIPAPAGAATITCKHVSGYMDYTTPYFTIGACTNHPTATGHDGDMTWSDGTTTTWNTRNDDLIGGPNACGQHKLWVIVDGIVNGGTSTFTQVGDSVRFQLCGTPYTASSLRRKNHTGVTI